MLVDVLLPDAAKLGKINHSHIMEIIHRNLATFERTALWQCLNKHNQIVEYAVAAQHSTQQACHSAALLLQNFSDDGALLMSGTS